MLFRSGGEIFAETSSTFAITECEVAPKQKDTLLGTYVPSISAKLKPKDNVVDPKNENYRIRSGMSRKRPRVVRSGTMDACRRRRPERSLLFIAPTAQGSQ